MNDTENKTLEQKVDEIAKEPLTAKERLGGIVLIVVCLSLCAGTWLKPDLFSIDTSELSGRGGRKIARILNIIWSRPSGTIAGLIGLLLVCGTIFEAFGKKR